MGTFLYFVTICFTRHFFKSFCLKIINIMESEYKMPDTGEFYVTKDIRDSFDKNGYILVRGLFKIDEVTKLRTHLELSQSIQGHSYGRSDGMERFSRMCVWSYATDDVSGVVARYTILKLSI
jgi:hypothetical protein